MNKSIQDNVVNFSIEIFYDRILLVTAQCCFPFLYLSNFDIITILSSSNYAQIRFAKVELENHCSSKWQEWWGLTLSDPQQTSTQSPAASARCFCLQLSVRCISMPTINSKIKFNGMSWRSENTHCHTSIIAICNFLQPSRVNHNAKYW